MTVHNFHNLGRDNAARREQAAERVAKAAKLRREGCTGEEIARRLGVYIRVVWRYLARARQQGLYV